MCMVAWLCSSSSNSISKWPVNVPPCGEVQLESRDSCCESCVRFETLHSISPRLFRFAHVFVHSSAVMQLCVTVVCGAPGTGLPIACIFATTSGGIVKPPIVIVDDDSHNPIFTG